MCTVSLLGVKKLGLQTHNTTVLQPKVPADACSSKPALSSVQCVSHSFTTTKQTYDEVKESLGEGWKGLESSLIIPITIYYGVQTSHREDDFFWEESRRKRGSPCKRTSFGFKTGLRQVDLFLSSRLARGRVCTDMPGVCTDMHTHHPARESLLVLPALPSTFCIAESKDNTQGVSGCALRMFLKLEGFLVVGTFFFF